MARRSVHSYARSSISRPAPPPIREVILRGSASLAQRLTSWRGLSGRTYVFAIHTIALGDVPEAPGAVILGVRKDVWATRHIVGAGHRGTVAEALALCVPDGATEIHLHHLEDDAVARDAIVADLVGDNAL